MPFDEPIECPLCMEPLDIDDLNFYPCTCGYQICRFCWHRIRTDENSLCPACRKQYQEDPAEFKPLTDEELTKIKKERRQKDVARKQKAAENRRHLANIRVVQKNLVFVVGLSNRLADTEVLKRQEYFGKYGKILKVVINSSTSYAGAQGPSASAYITYTRPEDCLRAIHAVNNLYVDGRTLKASLGTTKYCSHFLKGTQCTKTDCMYLHELGDGEASFTKDEMQSGKHQDYEQKLADTYLTPNNHTPVLSTQVSNTKTTDITNGTAPSSSKPLIVPTTTSQRKKTDSGSSGGSGKSKEPWPLLNSAATGRNTNQSNIGCKDGETVIDGSGSDQNDLDYVVNKHNTPPDDTFICKVNGVDHSSPSSNCSTTSHPGTPTPADTLSSISPRMPNTSSENDRNSPLLPVNSLHTKEPPALLAARKLPFSEIDHQDESLENHNTVQPGVLGTDSLPSKDRLHPGGTQSQVQNTDSFGFSSLGSREIKSQPNTSTSASDWPTSTFEHATTLPSDDDLGFDPFLESNKGLADMLENETGERMSPLPGFGLGLQMHHRRPPPGVAPPPHLHHPVGMGGLFSSGIMSSIVAPSSASMSLPSVVSSNGSTLPPPPPGLSAFPQFAHNGGMPQSPNHSSQDMPSFRGSRMLGLMNLTQPVGLSQSMPHMVPQSPVNTMPRSPYNDSRMQPPSTHNQNSFSGYQNGGMSDSSSFNTQDLRESLKALLPNASINFAPGIPSHQPLQHSRLRNNYMQPSNNGQPQNTSSWNGHISQQTENINSLDDQFSDPAIVSGCLSSDTNSSPPGAQPHWLKSIQQLTESESSPMKYQVSSQQHMQQHGMQQSNLPSAYRQPATHSRMPFAQNIHMSQPGANTGGWPTLQAHNPPPGFQSAFRSAAQNPHIATLES